MLKKMMNKTPFTRIKLAEALEHDWFKVQHEESKQHKIDEHVIKSLKEYKSISKLKKAALNVLVRMLEPK